jgi:hypothetical protein
MHEKNVPDDQSVPIRELFRVESELTTWLANHIMELKKYIGLTLVVVGTEVPTGDFRADILCEDAQGNKVVIENQLERTDHSHLGQLKTYMMHHKANTAIWISPNPRSEHIEAINAENGRSKEGYAYYLLQIAAKRANNGVIKPVFNVIVHPSQELIPTSSKVETRTSLQTPKRTTAQKSASLTKRLPQTVWCIYPQRNKDTYDFFRENNVIGLGIGGMGDLTKILATTEAFKEAWQRKYPQLSDSQIRAFYPMQYSFVHRAAIGDLVIYPSTWLDREINVGEITGPYHFKRWQLDGYPDRRSVNWRCVFSRDQFSSQALKGIGVNLAFFQVRNEAFLNELARVMENC